MAVHPSILKARALLENSDEQAIEFARWSAEHADELERIAADELITRKASVIIHRTYVDKGHHGLEFTMSTRSQDRMNDIIEQNWDLSHFNRNPICPFQHDTSFIVGKWSGVGVRDGA